jgi:nucleotide-binding universal stress UspA family protein
MRVLIATDGSEFSRAAVRKCCEMLSLQAANIKVISVAEVASAHATEPINVSGKYIREIQSAVLKQSDHFVRDAADVIRKTLCDADVEVTTGLFVGSPQQAILDEAQTWRADLIVVGLHGHGFLERMVLGSVSNSLINQAPCSVLVVHKPE